MYLSFKKKWMINFVVILLLWRTLLPGFIPYNLSYVLTNLTFVVVIGIVVIYYRHVGFNWRVLPVLLLFIVYCNKNYYYGAERINFILYGITLFMMLLALSGEGEWIKFYLKGATVLSMVHACATIVFRFVPSLYLGVVAPLYPATYSRLVNWYAEGCMAGLAGHYSTNGMWLVVGLYASVALAFTSDKEMFKRAIPSLIILIAIMLTGKRSHLFFSIIVLYTLYYCYLSNDKRTRTVRMVAAALIVLLVGFIIILYVPSLGNAFSRFKESADNGDITNNRIYFWGLAIQLFNENPLLGVGWGRFQDYCEMYLAYRAHAHNTFIQLLCETGVVGFAAYAGWMVTLLIVVIRQFTQVRKTSNDMVQLGMLAFSLQMQIFFFLYCFTGNPLYEKEMFVPYFVSCAIVFYQGYIDRKKRLEA